MSARILEFPREGRETDTATFTEPRLQRLAEAFAAAVDRKTGKPVGMAEGIKMTRSFLELMEQERAKGNL